MEGEERAVGPPETGSAGDAGERPRERPRTVEVQTGNDADGPAPEEVPVKVADSAEEPAGDCAADPAEAARAAEVQADDRAGGLAPEEVPVEAADPAEEPAGDGAADPAEPPPAAEVQAPDGAAVKDGVNGGPAPERERLCAR